MAEPDEADALDLPPPPQAMANYSLTVLSGNLLHVAGQGPMRDGKPTVVGKVGREVTIEQAYEAARLSCLNALAAAKRHMGSLDAIARAVTATVYVASDDDFVSQPKVADGVTDVLKELWGPAGLPARAAVGVNALPMGIPVEVQLVFETKPNDA